MQPYTIKHYDRPQHLAPGSALIYSNRHHGRPQHLAPGSVWSYDNQSRHNVAHTALAAVLAGLLAFPGTAFAATEVGVDGTTYTEAAGDGSTWSWDGADYMELNGYNGSGINAVGDLTIDLYGDNFINAEGNDYGVGVTNGDLTITGENGDGGLYIDTENTGSGDFGIGTDTGSVTIDNADVTINTDSCAIHTYEGDVTIENGSNVTANTNDYAAIHAGLGGDGDVNITDSTVNAKCSDPEGNAIIAGQNENYDSNSAPVSVNIKNSNVNAEGGKHAIYSQGGMNLDNSDIKASTTSDDVSAQAEEGSSKGAAIAAQETIRFSSTNLNGQGLSDQSDGELHYLGYSDGTPARIVNASHTGAASKFVNGVGRERTDGASSIARADSSHAIGNRAAVGVTTAPSASAGNVRQASTGGGIDGVTTAPSASAGNVREASTGGSVASVFAELATAVTSDPTTFGTGLATFASGIVALTAGIIRKERS